MPDWLEKLTIGLLTFVTGGGGVAWWATVRKEKREDRADGRAETAGTVNVVSGMLGDITTAHRRITELFNEVDAARTDAAAARRDALEANERTQQTRSELSRVRATLAYIATHVGPILDWIDAGAQPPVPEIPEDLRRLIDVDDDASVTRDHR